METLGERLFYAREIYAGITQEKLAAASGVPQPTISKLERTKAKGSKFVVQLAKGCGVEPEWLAMGTEPMIRAYRISDARIEHALKVMESLPPDALDIAIKNIDQTSELVKKMQTKEASNGG